MDHGKPLRAKQRALRVRLRLTLVLFDFCCCFSTYYPRRTYNLTVICYLRLFLLFLSFLFVSTLYSFLFPSVLSLFSLLRAHGNGAFCAITTLSRLPHLFLLSFAPGAPPPQANEMGERERESRCEGQGQRGSGVGDGCSCLRMSHYAL